MAEGLDEAERGDRVDQTSGSIRGAPGCHVAAHHPWDTEWLEVQGRLKPRAAE